ncbi:hypothetical protein [Burkholderia cenocepacia]|uniref:hypothetical protein n=1 Tax=Burkholderia cenocepacia TaxID=95486 RepID=UPI00396B24B1
MFFLFKKILSCNISITAFLIFALVRLPSAKAVQKAGNQYRVTRGYSLELELRIAKNDNKIIDLPTF